MDYEFPSLAGLVNPALFHRILPWFVWRHRLSGVVLWAVMAWYDVRNDGVIDPWVDDPALWIEDWDGTPYHLQNGEGWLVYPGDLANEYTGQADVDGPVSSLRLELFRKGLEDYKYLRTLEQSMDNFPGNAKTQAQKLVSTARDLLSTISSFDRDARKDDNLMEDVKAILNANAESLDTNLTQSWRFTHPQGVSAPSTNAQTRSPPYFTYLGVLGAISALLVPIVILRSKRETTV